MYRYNLPSDGCLNDLPKNWAAIKYDVQRLIRNNQLSPITQDMVEAEENEDCCCVCFCRSKKYPLNCFDTCCVGKQYFCTLCLLNHPNFDLQKLSMRCAQCSKEIPLKYEPEKSWVAQSPTKKPSSWYSNRHYNCMYSSTTSAGQDTSEELRQTPLIPVRQCGPTQSTTLSHDFYGNVPPSRYVPSPRYVPLPQYVPPPRYIEEAQETYTTQSSIQRQMAQKEERRRREREEYERNIDPNVLQIFNKYRIVIPTMIPASMVNDIDIDLIDSREMAEMMIESLYDARARSQHQSII